MAHFAEVVDGTVARVVVVSNEVTTRNGVEVEQRGVDLLETIMPTAGAWVQTSYSASMRFNYAGAGHTWDGSGFASPRLFASWTLDAAYRWPPPTPLPDDGDVYTWDEA